MHRILIVDDKADELAPGLQAIFPDDRLECTRSGGEALERLADDDAFDAVLLDIRMPAELSSSAEEEGLAVLVRIREEWPDLPVILLAHSVKGVYPPPEGKDFSCIDQVFIWSGDSDLLLAIIKSVEDRLNVAADTEKAMVRVLLLVED